MYTCKHTMKCNYSYTAQVQLEWWQSNILNKLGGNGCLHRLYKISDLSFARIYGLVVKTVLILLQKACVSYPSLSEHFLQLCLYYILPCGRRKKTKTKMMWSTHELNGFVFLEKTRSDPFFTKHYNWKIERVTAAMFLKCSFIGRRESNAAIMLSLYLLYSRMFRYDNRFMLHNKLTTA